MRAEIAVIAGFILLASCGPTQEGSSPPVAAANRQQPSTTAVPLGRDTNRIEHFWFSYPYQPQPGSRVWINVKATNWVEVYPDGSQSHYRLVGRESVDGLSGIVVAKTAGDVETTQTLNDGSFQAFLPDKNSARIVLYFRNKTDGQWQPWRPLAQINPIE
jgi:hypothetical protein